MIHIKFDFSLLQRNIPSLVHSERGLCCYCCFVDYRNSRLFLILQSHLCLFSGWLREFHGPGFLEVVAPQLVSKKV